MTENDILAGASGQEATIKEPVEAHKASKGVYVCPVGDHAGTQWPGQPTSEKQPMSLTKG